MCSSDLREGGRVCGLGMKEGKIEGGKDKGKDGGGEGAERQRQRWGSF